MSSESRSQPHSDGHRENVGIDLSQEHEKEKFSNRSGESRGYMLPPLINRKRRQGTDQLSQNGGCVALLNSQSNLMNKQKKINMMK